MERRAEGRDEGIALPRAIFDSALDAILIADDERRYVEANPAACELFALPRDQLIGRRIDDFAGPDARGLVAGTWREFIASGSQAGRFLLHLDDGSVRHVDYRARASFLPGRHLSFMHDVTATVAAEEELLRSRAALERALRARDELVTIISHDLRDPLSVVRLSASAFRMSLARGPDPRLFERGIDQIERAVGRMETLLSGLLDLARLDEGRLPLAASPQPLAPILEEACRNVQVLATHKGIQLAPAEGVEFRVICDRARLLQVLNNLLGNAIKFTPRGGLVRIEAAESGAEAVVVVSDSGRGIPPADLPRVFDRYYTSGRDGSGIGLAIVKGVVEAHGGRVWAESTRGAGSRFGFSIPLARHR